LTVVGCIVSFVLSFFFGYCLTPLVKGIAVRWKLTEKPNGRNGRDIAHIGGVAIIGAVLFTLIVVFLFHLPPDQLYKAFNPVLIASGFLIFLLGIIDDLRSLHYVYKLSVQIIVAIFVSVGGLGLLHHFGLLQLSFMTTAVSFFAVSFWILAITTSFNLIDGIDGLSSGIALIASIAFGVAGFLFDQPLIIALSLAVFGAVTAFLRYNFPPAKILMGDSGSLFLGLLFGLISLLALVPGDSVFYRACGGIVILSIPLIDTTLAFLRRLVSGRPVFEADLKHIHHILLYRFNSVRTVDAILWGLSGVFGVLGVLIMTGSRIALAAAVALELFVCIAALRGMVTFNISRERAEEILEQSGIHTSRLVPRED
jgi:UDP-GlcNAc:undecaprenyl-phosphate GlcNAc-1-phosphate transferase